MGHASAIAHAWIIGRRVQIGIQAADGRLSRGSHLHLQEGDFLDVEVRADVVTRGKHGNKRIDLQFAMVTVIQLKARAQTTEVGTL